MSIDDVKGAKLEAYDDQGEYASTSFVLDDDTIIVHSAFALGPFRGQIFSEVWVRREMSWKLKSQMLAIHELHTVTTTTSTEKASWWPFAGEKEKADTDASTTTQ